MDSQVREIVSQTENSEIWKALTSAETELALVRGILRELHLEIFHYNPHIVEAGMGLIGQMPRSMAPRKIKAMVRHLAEEFDHGEMALKDYVTLGGNEEQARAGRRSPGALAAGGIWWMLLHLREPFAYLGGMYLFETLTPIICERVQPTLANRHLADGQLEFIRFHSAEDPKHASLMRELVKSTVAQFPESAAAMRYGFDCFQTVYPGPVWQGAYHRALASAKSRMALSPTSGPC
jgi:hypothetical protein